MPSKGIGNQRNLSGALPTLHELLFSPSPHLPISPPSSPLLPIRYSLLPKKMYLTQFKTAILWMYC
ncbi:MAG: hypothetical protein F6J90_01940 [Moorea sp. SIOASIH]|uniref:hypothetical protein n=1 Tax=Moorena sp. SIOASIH TaxID=2607817 RepID=UPI0013B818A3|nr:hypothetical protein [Moorena sp. SIOASIH]NEO35130.1 hypothetical protein [Moorena sp. SIOASIH]